MAPVLVDKWGTKYDRAPSKTELEASRLRSLQPKKIEVVKMSILPVELPKIIIKPDLNSDPCVDDLDMETNDSPDIMKIILIGVVVGVILGVFK